MSTRCFYEKEEAIAFWNRRLVMYDALAKRLRERGEFLTVSDKMKAPPNVNVRNVFAEDYAQAADAIEALQHTIREMAAVGKFLLEVHELDCQYPTVRLRGMNEPLPKDPYDCLVIVRETPCGGGDNSLNYFPGFAKYDGEQWNDKAGMKVPFEVVYWMPLPEPPKEVT